MDRRRAALRHDREGAGTASWHRVGCMADFTGIGIGTVAAGCARGQGTGRCWRTSCLTIQRFQAAFVDFFKN